MPSKPAGPRGPYRIVVLLGSEEGCWEIEESAYLKTLANTYKAFYQYVGKDLGVGRLQFSVKKTSSREQFKRQLTNIRRRPKEKPTDGIHFIGHSAKEADGTFLL